MDVFLDAYAFPNMDDAKQNQQRAPKIELPPPLSPKPPGETPDKGVPKEEPRRHPINREQPASFDTALRSAGAEEGVAKSNSRETKNELPAREAAGDAPPVTDAAAKEAAPQQKKKPPSSDMNAVVWIGVAVLIGFVAIIFALQNPIPQGADVTQRTPIETTPSTEPAVSNSANGAELRSPPAEPAVAPGPNYSPPRNADSDTAILPPSPRVSRSPSRSPSVATPAPKTDAGRTYVWRGRTYYISPNQMQRFDAIKKAGRTKLAAMEKLAAQINSIGLQMQKADKRTKSRLASQREALTAQHSQASAEYARLVSEMDQFISSFVNP